MSLACHIPLALVVWSCLQQGAAAAAATQADDAAALLQFQAAYGLVAADWSGSEPCAAGDWHGHVAICCQAKPGQHRRICLTCCLLVPQVQSGSM